MNGRKRNIIISPYIVTQGIYTFKFRGRCYNFSRAFALNRICQLSRFRTQRPIRMRLEVVFPQRHHTTPCFVACSWLREVRIQGQKRRSLNVQHPSDSIGSPAMSDREVSRLRKNSALVNSVVGNFSRRKSGDATGRLFHDCWGARGM